MKRLFLGIFTLALLPILSACNSSEDKMKPKDSSSKTDTTKEAMNIDKMTAPDFEMQDLEGNVVKLSDFSGENVYIKYWASWCSICLGGLEDLNTLALESNDYKIITIVGPNYKGEKNANDFREWFSGVEHTENLIVLLDENGTYTAAAGVRGYPTSEWIDREGNIMNITPGHVDNDLVKAGFSDMK